MTNPNDQRGLKAFFSTGLIYLTGTVAIRATAFILIPIYTGMLTKSDFGLLALAEVYRAVLTNLNSIGQGGAIGYFSTRKNENISAVAGTGLSIVALWSIPFGAVLIFLREPIAALLFTDDVDAHSITLIVVSSILGTFHAICMSTLRFENRAKLRSILEWGYSTLNLLLNIVFVLLLKWGFLGILWAWTCTTAGMVLVEIPILLAPILRAKNNQLIGPMLRFGFPLILNSFSNIVFTSADRVILSAFLGLDALGIYALGTKIASIPHIICAPFQQAYVPYLFRLERNDKKDMKRLGLAYCVLGAVLVVTVGLFSTEFVAFFGSGKYADSLPIMNWLLTAFALKIAYEAMGFGPVYAGKPSIMVVIVTISAALNVALNLWWIPQYGIYGAMAGTVLSIGVMTSVSIVVTSRILGFSFRSAQLLKSAVVGTCIANAYFGLYTAPLSLRLAVFLCLMAVVTTTVVKLGYHQKILESLRNKIEKKES